MRVILHQSFGTFDLALEPTPTVRTFFCQSKVIFKTPMETNCAFKKKSCHSLNNVLKIRLVVGLDVLKKKLVPSKKLQP